MDETKDFSWALQALKADYKVCRNGWNGKGMYLFIENPIRLKDRPHDESEFERLPYIMMKTADNCLVPWLASQTDILADDWIIVEGKKRG